MQRISNMPDMLDMSGRISQISGRCPPLNLIKCLAENPKCLSSKVFNNRWKRQINKFTFVLRGNLLHALFDKELAGNKNGKDNFDL